MNKLFRIVKMVNRLLGVIVIIVLLLVFITLLAVAFRGDDGSVNKFYPKCPYQPKTTSEQVISRAIRQDPKIKMVRLSIEKYCTIEHEIDTLTRSYTIERLCECDDAGATYERIISLCDKIADCLSIVIEVDQARRYAQGRKQCLIATCQLIDQCRQITPKASQEWYTAERYSCAIIAQSLGVSKEYLETIRVDHCNLTVQMIESQVKKNSLGSIIAYNHACEKTDLYLETISGVFYDRF